MVEGNEILNFKVFLTMCLANFIGYLSTRIDGRCYGFNAPKVVTLDRAILRFFQGVMWKLFYRLKFEPYGWKKYSKTLRISKYRRS